MYRAYRRRKLGQNKGSLEDLLFGDNIIGQLVTFGLNLVTSGLSLMKSLKTMTYDKLKKEGEMTEEEKEKEL